MEIIYNVAASLDGFIATPERGIDWLKPFECTSEDYGYGEFYASIEALGGATDDPRLQFPNTPGWWAAASSPQRPGPRDDLRLKSSRSYPSGIVQLRYETVL